MYGGDEVPEEPRGRGRSRSGGDAEPRERGRRESPRAAPVSRDPFFDKPYEEPKVVDAVPSWESTTPRVARTISANIKTKRRVAALFKPETPVSDAVKPETPDSEASQRDIPVSEPS